MAGKYRRVNGNQYKKRHFYYQAFGRDVWTRLLIGFQWNNFQWSFVFSVSLDIFPRNIYQKILRNN